MNKKIPYDPIQRLRDPGFYDHPVTAVECLETHISRIFLAGDFAYKVKKPVNFGFLDFSTLGKRHFFCTEEVRLNQRFSSGFYLSVVSLGSARAPHLHGLPAAEFAVKMRRFPQQSQLDRMLEAGRLKSFQLECFADRIAAIHMNAAIAPPESSFGSPELVLAPVRESLARIKTLLSDTDQLERIAELENWCLTTFKRLQNKFQQRKLSGAIRECHGDLHLANMAWVDEQPLLFDCIEFSENLRWIDSINDIAFLAMDLDDRNQPLLGWAFLNRYLSINGDYQGLKLLNFYKVYRALVRAKVTCLRLTQSGPDDAERSAAEELLQSYLDLAQSYTRPPKPLLIITHGLSGSGKTTLVSQLAPLCHAISLHSDLERKRLHHLSPTQTSQSPLDGGIYTAAAGQATYDRLAQLAEGLLESGIPTCVDATFINQEQRQWMKTLAENYGAQFLILDFPLDEQLLRSRIQRRMKQPDQVSEATTEVLDRQLSSRDPLTETERQLTLTVTPATRAGDLAARIATVRT